MYPLKRELPQAVALSLTQVIGWAALLQAQVIGRAAGEQTSQRKQQWWLLLQSGKHRVVSTQQPVILN